ncbi:prolyl aminopeptidase [Dechloromonas sp. XY25]|uniref:Proline iminopeptidase n=1 Tax=Dechloromonas hankyongensis TaxID=2908002 RepID=A0ABS9K0Y7_9RHOO|nr:prolyl aminopeptidase [Dechloromonas hankyongensis]MCG2576840.1 prolyl aminopeptidase [Dechloromonas hankyongensis]
MSINPLFPEAQPRCARRIAVGDGHYLYVEELGPADGLPVLFLHGGPGSGCTPAQRRLFDPQRFRAILVDQRGAGRSLPLGELGDNTTADLVADLEIVREALGIPAWIVFGGSWGSLLALAYAQIYPERVLGLVLRGIFLGSRQEIAAYVGGINPLAHHAWTAFASALQEPASAYLLATCADRILRGKASQAMSACRAWLDYERALLGEPPLEREPDDRELAKVRIQMHYLTRDCFLMPGQLLAGVERLRHIPAAIVQGLADPVCPPQAAEMLHRAWPEATWFPVAQAGHAGLSPPIARACIKALEWVAEAASNFAE